MLLWISSFCGCVIYIYAHALINYMGGSCDKLIDLAIYDIGVGSRPPLGHVWLYWIYIYIYIPSASSLFWILGCTSINWSLQGRSLAYPSCLNMDKSKTICLFVWNFHCFMVSNTLVEKVGQIRIYPSYLRIPPSFYKFSVLNPLAALPLVRKQVACPSCLNLSKWSSLCLISTNSTTTWFQVH
jgi:hypothetical protein